MNRIHLFGITLAIVAFAGLPLFSSSSVSRPSQDASREKDEISGDLTKAKLRTPANLISSVSFDDFEATIYFKKLDALGKRLTLKHVPRDLALAVAAQININKAGYGLSYKDGKVVNDEIIAVLNGRFQFFGE